MIETAENLRRGTRSRARSRTSYAVRSHERAAAAARRGRFADELVPVTINGRKGDTVVDRDEHIRPGRDARDAREAAPDHGPDDPDATVTAGNASGQNDGAAVVHRHDRREGAPSWGCGRWRGWCRGACRRPPQRMGIGPVPATAKALAQAGLSWPTST